MGVESQKQINLNIIDIPVLLKMIFSGYVKCKIINFTLTSVAQWCKINPLCSRTQFSQHFMQGIRVLYRNQGFLPHKWATIVAVPLSPIIETSNSHTVHHSNLTWHERVREKLNFNQKIYLAWKSVVFLRFFFYTVVLHP